MSGLVTKPTKWSVHPAKPQISLGICPVWSESLLSAWRKLGSLAIIKRTAKTLIRLGGCPADLILRWALMSVCWFCHEAAHIRSTVLPQVLENLGFRLWGSRQCWFPVTDCGLVLAMVLSSQSHSQKVIFKLQLLFNQRSSAHCFSPVLLYSTKNLE